ncbi:MAG TPA: hypothetical protein VJT09_10520 [Pyrinomonadaceae bacterium]|nr:hypothetical protein [Pyrinomonadaceae bacterium]
MRDERLFSAPAGAKRSTLLLACALLLFYLAPAALAQSGRRQVKNPSPTPPVEDKAEAKPSPTPTKVAAPIASLIITGDRSSASFEIPTGYLDFATNACFDRLEKSASLKVSLGNTNLSRKDAIDTAKKQEESYIVWLELRGEVSGSDLTNVVIQYSVFSPQTAKVKTFGTVYLDRTGARSGRVAVGLPPTSNRRLPLDYLLREGGRAVAERLMDHFRVSLPD